jgi:hypothetical protein
MKPVGWIQVGQHGFSFFSVVTVAVRIKAMVVGGHFQPVFFGGRDSVKDVYLARFTLQPK